MKYFGWQHEYPSVLWLVPIAILGTDQFCKYLAARHLQHKNVRVGKTPVVLRCSYNRGAAMNFMQDRPDLVRDISAVMSGAVTAMFVSSVLNRSTKSANNYVKSDTRTGIRAAGFGLLCGGAWSNTLDRLRGVPVTDYISFDVGPKQARDIVYNLADFAIAAGTLITIVEGTVPDQDQ